MDDGLAEQLAVLSECPELRKVTVELIVLYSKPDECDLHDTLEALVESLEALGDNMEEVWRVKIATHWSQCYFPKTEEQGYQSHKLHWEGKLSGLRELRMTMAERRHMQGDDGSHVHYSDRSSDDDYDDDDHRSLASWISGVSDDGDEEAERSEAGADVRSSIKKDAEDAGDLAREKFIASISLGDS